MTRPPLAHRLLTRLLGGPEEINGAERCPTYLYRWTVLKLGARGVYVHRFVGDDWSRDLHDHPKRFVSIGLWGAYQEWTPIESFSDGEIYEERIGMRTFRAPWVRSFPATHIHRLTLPRYCAGCGAPENRPEAHSPGCYIPLCLPRDCWTLVIVLKAVRSWGFWHAGRFIGWREYVRADNKLADEMKACP